MNVFWWGRGKIESEWLSRSQDKVELAGILWLSEKNSWNQGHMGGNQVRQVIGARWGKALESGREMHISNDGKEWANENFWAEVKQGFISALVLKKDGKVLEG